MRENRKLYNQKTLLIKRLTGFKVLGAGQETPYFNTFTNPNKTSTKYCFY